MSDWMDVAWTQVGQTEVSGPGANPAILAYFKGVGAGDVTSDEVAWCAAFAGYCLSSAGVPLDRIPKHLRLAARAYLSIGTPIDEPRVGALVVFARPDAGPDAGHVGFVAGSTDLSLMVLGGNQADSVCVRSFPRDVHVLGYRWPAAPQAPEAVAVKSRIAGAASSQVSDVGKVGVAQAAGQVPGTPQVLHDMAGEASAMSSQIKTIVEFGTYVWSQRVSIVTLLTAFWLVRLVYNAWMIRHWRTEDANTGKTASGASDAQTA